MGPVPVGRGWGTSGGGRTVDTDHGKLPAGGPGQVWQLGGRESGVGCSGSRRGKREGWERGKKKGARVQIGGGAEAEGSGGVGWGRGGLSNPGPLGWGQERGPWRRGRGSGREGGRRGDPF